MRIRNLLRCLLFLLLVMSLTGGLSLLAAAEEPEKPVLAVRDAEDGADTMPPGYSDLEDHLPSELSGLLPDGLFSENTEEALAAATELTDWRYLLNALMSAVGLRLDRGVGLLCTLLGLILLAALLGRLREGLGGSGDLFGFCLRLAVYTAAVLQTASVFETVTLYFSQLTSLTGGMIPVMGTLYAMGGNLGRAAVNGELMLVFLAVCEYVSTTVTPPVCGLCMAFSLTDAFGSRLTLAPLCEQVKKWYVSLLGTVMFLLSLALSAQSVLVSRGDSLGMKGIKYAVGNMIPVVGGAVAGTLSTVAAGISVLRGIFGVSGLILLALLLLPALAELLLARAVLQLASTAAALLGCDSETKLLSQIASLYGYLAAAASICAVAFALALSLLIHSSAALA